MNFFTLLIYFYFSQKPRGTKYWSAGLIFVVTKISDERALVNGAKDYGWTFVTRTPDTVEVEILGERKRFQILNVLEFTSKRKRMSVIVKDPNGVIKLYCKVRKSSPVLFLPSPFVWRNHNLFQGADTVIYERLAPDKRQFREVTLKQLEDFATEGLRTLCCAYAVVPKQTYEVKKLNI